MIKEKQFRLILRKPGKPDEVLAEGGEGFIGDLKIKKSFDINPDFLVMEEIKSDSAVTGKDIAEVLENLPEETKELPLGTALVVVAASILTFIILKKYGRK